MPISKEISDKIQQIGQLMDPVIEDTSVPRNIRKTVTDAKLRIMSSTGDLDVNVSSALLLLDEISNDINMPGHARTQIWNLISELEKIKQEINAE
jgi:hypothetical protein